MLAFPGSAFLPTEQEKGDDDEVAQKQGISPVEHLAAKMERAYYAGGTRRADEDQRTEGRTAHDGSAAA